MAKFDKEFYTKMISELQQLRKEMSVGISDLGGYKRHDLLGTIKILKEEIVWNSEEPLRKSDAKLENINEDDFMEDESEYDPSTQASKNEERFKELNDGH